jgi:hypothetical protein
MPAHEPVASIISRSKMCALEPLRFQQASRGIELVEPLAQLSLMAMAWISVGRGVTV